MHDLDAGDELALLLAQVLVASDGKTIPRTESALSAELREFVAKAQLPTDRLVHYLRALGKERHVEDRLMRMLLTRTALGTPVQTLDEIHELVESSGLSKAEAIAVTTKLMDKRGLRPAYQVPFAETSFKYQFNVSIKVDVRALRPIRTLWDRKLDNELSAANESVSVQVFVRDLVALVNDEESPTRRSFPPRDSALRTEGLSRFFASLEHLVIADAIILQGSMEREIELVVVSDHPIDHIAAFVRDGVDRVNGVVGIATLVISWRYADASWLKS
jgi:hypothetical protein